MSSGRMYKPFQPPADYRQRLPTEYPFAVALGLYLDRVVVVGAVALVAIAASLIVFVAIVAFQLGYGFIVVIVVGVVLFSLRGGGAAGGGSSGGGQAPPNSNGTIVKRPSGTQQPKPADREEVPAPARRPRELVH